MLISREVDVNCQNGWEQGSPLAYAALGNQKDTCSFLLLHGAKIDSEDIDGDTALFQALLCNSHAVYRVLLDAGANYLHTNRHMRTLLHIIAIAGDVETASILSQVFLQGLDPDARDDRGRTAREYLQMRVTIPDGFVEAFDQLVENIKIANAKVEELEDDDMFEDALEYLIDLKEA